MQTVCRGIRGVRCAKPSLIVTSSQVQWHPCRSIMQWIKKKVTANVREQDAASPAKAKTPLLSPSDPSATGEEEESMAEIHETERPRKKYTEHKYSTTNFKISHRKLNMLGRQIAGKPIDHAILQMMFSEKRASRRIKSMLVLAREHATRYKGLDLSKLVVSEAWVTKGQMAPPQVEPRARGHFGIRTHPKARMHVVLREGKTPEEQRMELTRKQLKRIVSAGLTREDIPIRNPGPYWGW